MRIKAVGKGDSKLRGKLRTDCLRKWQVHGPQIREEASFEKEMASVTVNRSRVIKSEGTLCLLSCPVAINTTHFPMKKSERETQENFKTAQKEELGQL